jgi:hypothetical protein
VVVVRPVLAVGGAVVQHRGHGHHLDNNVIRAVITRQSTLSKRAAAFQSYCWIAPIGDNDQNVGYSFSMNAMSVTPEPDGTQAEIDRLATELEKAEAYEVRLRQFFVDIKAELAVGHTANAMSMLNEALRYIDDATDVVAPHRDG